MGATGFIDGAAFVSLIGGTDDDHDGGSIGGWSLALVGGAFRLLRSPLKRTAPTDARGRCPQKIKFGSFVKGRTTITAAIKGRSYA